MVATVNNGVIIVRMINPYSKPQRIYNGSTIGQLYPLKGKHDLGEIRNVKHTIDTEGSRPIRIPYRRLPHRQRKNIRTEIYAMLMAGVIEPSNSPWPDPVVMVKKKDGLLRLCLNYRKLNLVTKGDVYPLPRCDDIREAMSGAAFFTHHDLVRGY